jgi:hypothetical protein
MVLLLKVKFFNKNGSYNIVVRVSLLLVFTYLLIFFELLFRSKLFCYLSVILIVLLDIKLDNLIP